MRKRVLILVLDHDREGLSTLNDVLRNEGYEVEAVWLPDVMNGAIDLLKVVGQSDPALIIYDIAPPYARNWVFYRLVRQALRVDEVPVVVTTTDLAALEKIVGSTGAFHAPERMVCKPYGVVEIMRAIESLIGTLPGKSAYEEHVQ